MDCVHGTLPNAEASAIAAAAASGENPRLLGGAFNLNVPVERSDGDDVVFRIPRGDRKQNEAQPLERYDAAAEAEAAVRARGLKVVVPQALWVGREPGVGQEPGGGERAEIWERFPGQQIDQVWEEQPPPEVARAAIADAITAFATHEPRLLRERYPGEPRTCGESHQAMLRHFAENVEPSHWDTFGLAYEAIGAQREAVEVRSGRYEHPAPWLPTRLVHNDLNPRNFLASGQRNPEFAVVDWDLATPGDPAFDVARVIQTWELPPQHADELRQRVKEGLHAEDPRLADHFDERVDVYYQFLHNQRLLLLASRIADTVRAAPPDEQGRQQVLDEAAEDANRMLPSLKKVLGTRIIPGEEFVDLVLNSEQTASSRNGRRDAPLQARVLTSSG